MKNAKVGTALLGGYVLGRTKKAKLAISLGALLAGSRIRPGQLGKALEQSPFLSNISKQVRTELTDASKAAATSLLTAKADSLADALHERTAGLQERALRHEDEDEEQEEDREARGREESRQDEEPQGEGREKKQHRRSSRTGPSGGQGESRKRKPAATKSRAGSGASRARRPDDG